MQDFCTHCKILPCVLPSASIDEFIHPARGVLCSLSPLVDAAYGTARDEAKVKTRGFHMSVEEQKLAEKQ